jgi:hypothetical protein
MGDNRTFTDFFYVNRITNNCRLSP